MASRDDVQRRNADRFGCVRAGEAFADFLDELAEGVSASEDDVDDGRGDRKFTAAGCIEYALQLVRQIFDCFQAKVAGASFESVEGPENSVQRILVGGVFFEDEYTLFDVL